MEIAGELSSHLISLAIQDQTDQVFSRVSFYHQNQAEKDSNQLKSFFIGGNKLEISAFSPDASSCYQRAMVELPTECGK